MSGASANLSHRGALACNEGTVRPEERTKFARACRDAQTFGNLPQKWKDRILEAERRIVEAGYTLKYPQDDS
jgi:hypothetical protein